MTQNISVIVEAMTNFRRPSFSVVVSAGGSLVFSALSRLSPTSFCSRYFATIANTGKNENEPNDNVPHFTFIIPIDTK